MTDDVRSSGSPKSRSISSRASAAASTPPKKARDTSRWTSLRCGRRSGRVRRVRRGRGRRAAGKAEGPGPATASRGTSQPSLQGLKRAREGFPIQSRGWRAKRPRSRTSAPNGIFEVADQDRRRVAALPEGQGQAPGRVAQPRLRRRRYRLRGSPDRGRTSAGCGCAARRPRARRSSFGRGPRSGRSKPRLDDLTVIGPFGRDLSPGRIEIPFEEGEIDDPFVGREVRIGRVHDAPIILALVLGRQGGSEDGIGPVGDDEQDVVRPPVPDEVASAGCPGRR